MYVVDMSRPVDEQRPEELRAAILEYLIEHGITDWSLRPLAKAVRSSPRALLYHFESKEKLLMSVLVEIRQRQQLLFAQIQSETFAEACGEIWKTVSSPSLEQQVRLFFELYGVALRQPVLYKEFLGSAVDDWLEFAVKQLRKEGYKRREAVLIGTTMLAGFRGFLLDLSATHDRERVNRAVFAWLQTLDKIVPPGEV
jgi:AcrR family transcriptional regulator